MESTQNIPELSRETTIRRDKGGKWYHEGQLVEHPAVIRAFNAWMDQENGRFILRNSVNWAYVEIEGAPIFVRRIRQEVSGFELELSNGQTEFLEIKTLCRDENGRLYCRVRQQRWLAEFTRLAMLDVMPFLDGDEEVMELQDSQGAYSIPLVALDDLTQVI